MTLNERGVARHKGHVPHLLPPAIGAVSSTLVGGMRQHRAVNQQMGVEPRPVDLIVRPAPAAVREVWPGEATDFTPWLAANLDWLDVLGLGPLTLVGIEVPIPGVSRNLDIFATGADGTKVAIENQYRRVDHDHLTRGLAYAVGHEAGALVVIAEDHSREFVAIADYLNTAYEELGPKKGIAVFLVSFGVQKVGKHFVPRFDVVSRPNTWLTEVQQATGASGTTPSVEAFLAQCAPEFQPNATTIVRDWLARAGARYRLDPGSTSISLDYPYDPASGKQSIYAAYINGRVTINRGYFRESIVTEDLLPEMDRRLRELFPGYKANDFYPSVLNPDPASIATFADWLISLRN